ncbi:PepSY-associated TM helix domain-containing protein [Pacificimonas sp. ICDLI1SI03]
MAAPAQPDEPGGVRLALNWLHTWFGLLSCLLLLVIFWTGTLAVFDWEIDRWMKPATRFTAPTEMSIDAFRPVAEASAPGAEFWQVQFATDRAPAEFYAQLNDGTHFYRTIGPDGLTLLPDQGTYGGTQFFYPYHFTLNIGFANIGLILCAFAGIMMMVLCVSGVIIHRRIFADFFTFRKSKKSQRSVLDLHNLTGVLALPFHFVISLSGVALFSAMYLPTAQEAVFASDPTAFDQDYFSRPATGEAGQNSASLDVMAEEAARRWDGVRPGHLRIYYPGDANSYVEARWPLHGSLAARYHSIWFDAATGDVLAAPQPSAASAGYAVLWGLHVVQFDHLTIRWLYFLSGLAGCVLIATGLLFWSQSRRKRHAKTGKKGAEIVAVIAIGGTTGLILATLAFLISNRLLPLDMEGRATLETWCFHAGWLAAFAHAGVRRGAAWREQWIAIAIGGVVAVALNAVTTGDAIPVAIARGQWGVAGIDIMLLLGSFLAIAAAWRMRNSQVRTREGHEKQFLPAEKS